MAQRRSWTEEEDKILKFLREQEKIKKWSEIAKRMQSEYGITQRNQKQCRQRYQNHLNSQIITEKLSDQEEKRLFQLHDQFGNKWSVIANSFSGRTDNTLKNHFHSKLRGAIRKVNRYLGCKKKRGAKSYPLNIVYKIVKFFGQNGKDLLEANEFNLVKKLKNNLLKFAGANVIIEDMDFDQKNEKQQAQTIVIMLQKFQKMIKPSSRRRISQISQSDVCVIKDLKCRKTEQSLPQTTPKVQGSLFRTFSQSVFIEKKVPKEKESKIETPIARKPIQIKSKVHQTPDLEFEQIQLRKKKSSQMSQQDSDILRLVQQKNISNLSGFPKMQKLSSYGSYSMQLIQDSHLHRNDSQMSRRSSNQWFKDFEQGKAESFIFL